MKKLISDWRVSTSSEKVRFIVVFATMLIVGIIGNINAMQFAYYAIAKPVSWHYLMVAITSVAILGLLALIKLSPKDKGQ